MKVVEMLNDISKEAGENKSTLLTVGAMLGVGVTVGTTVKGTLDAKKIIDAHPDGLKKEDIVAVAKCYILTAISAGITEGCIFGAHKEDTLKYAALAALYASDSKKVNECAEKIGLIEKKEEEEPKKEILGENLNPEMVNEVVEIYDEFGKKFIKTSVNAILYAVGCVNSELLGGDKCTYSEFLEELDSTQVPDMAVDYVWKPENGGLRVIFGADVDENLNMFLTFSFNRDPEIPSDRYGYC